MLYWFSVSVQPNLVRKIQLTYLYSWNYLSIFLYNYNPPKPLIRRYRLYNTTFIVLMRLLFTKYFCIRPYFWQRVHHSPQDTKKIPYFLPTPTCRHRVAAALPWRKKQRAKNVSLTSGAVGHWNWLVLCVQCLYVSPGLDKDNRRWCTLLLW